MSAHGGKFAARGHAAELGGEQVEGHHAVHGLLVTAQRKVRRIWVSDPRSGSGPLGEITELGRSRGVPVELKSPDSLLTASATGSPQGVIAWAAPVRAVDLEDLLEPPQVEVAGAAPAVPFLVVLDGVTDPGNFGAILRTAACAGAGGVVIGRHRSAPLTPAAVKAAAGAAELLPIAQVPGVPMALAQLAKSGVWVVGLGPSADADIWQAPLLDGPVALVLGSEGGGLSRLAARRCDLLVRVPQAQLLGSLNVAAAAAVACFEVARRRLGHERSVSSPIGNASGPPL